MSEGNSGESPADPADAHRALVRFAYEEAVRARQARPPAGLPTVEQVCAELWRTGAAMTFQEVLATVQELGLEVVDPPDNAANTTRKVNALR